jgi:predicted RNase H-like HicB family nuclease
VRDRPGCVAVADSRSDVLCSLDRAISMHLDGLREDGEPIPPARQAV